MIEYAPDGTQTNYWLNTNTASSSSGTISFATNAGYTYDIVVAAKDGNTGSYTLTYDSSVLTALNQMMPN